MIPKKPTDATWTDEQWQAIWAKGQDMLVSAAAGSGKTAVLINRMIEKVLAEEEPISVDELLVVTFTNASAAEMRHRMSKALEKAVAENPESAHLRKQLRLINKAQISTLHSFCLQVVKQYAYLLEIDPGFRIAGDTEAALLRDDVLESVLEESYEGEGADAVYRLADSFTSDRSDQAMEVLLSKLYDYSRVHPDPEEWLQQVPALYAVPETATIDELPFIGDLKLTIRHALEEALQLTQQGQQLALQPDGPALLEETFKTDAEVIRAAIAALEISWDSLYNFSKSFKFEKAASIKKDSCDPAVAEEAKGMRNDVKKIVAGLFDSYFTRTPKRLLDEMREMAPMMATLVELTQLFADRYKALKIDRALVDFSDLEHYALEILSDEGKPSAIAKEYQNRFKEVLVDEYQDTNMLQETILNLVKSGNEQDGNLFMVGDVKQSIYRFRLAEPMLFLGKYSRFSHDAEGTGLRIDLNANFRSRKEILDGTNYIFSQIMGQRVGEIDYDEAAALKAKAPYPEQQVPIELALIHEPETEEEAADEDLVKSQWEARFIAKKIKEMMDQEMLVHDPWTQQQRKLEYRDIVVLMRSMTWSGDFVDEFKMAGIPLYAELNGGYFDALEVMIMLNTLRVIDNPYQDIPLASVLRAPFIGLKENELAEIRLAAPNASFYEAVKTFMRAGTGIDRAAADKLQRFVLQLEGWRNQARRGSLAELIWQVYLDTNYYEMAGAMTNGKQRQANLRALHDRALEYEKTSFRGLFRFLRFIDRMRERGDDLGTAKSLSEKENVVRLMTVHKSKGLEFPVVFFAGTGRSFNEMDFRKSYLFDQDYGLAVKAVNPDTRIEYTSLPFLAVKEMKQLQMKAEEMRVLYVAMTRAKERLFLTASVKEIDKLFEKWKVGGNDVRLPDFMRSRAKGYLDWIGPAVARHPDAAELLSVNVNGNVLPHSSRFHIEIIESQSLLPGEINLEELLKGDDVNEDYQQLVNERFDFRYPHQRAVEKRSKQSVTEMKRLQMLQRLDEPESFIQTAKPERTMLLHRPDFMMDKRLSAADIGTAVHAVMQHIPLDRTMDSAEIKEFIDNLVGMEILSPDEGKAVKVEEIERFYASDTAERLRSAKHVKREVPFTYAKADADGDHQIIQGIVDCLFEEQDGWVLLDYKTDRLAHLNDVKMEMAERYGVQLTVYQEAVEAILRIPVKERLLYLFAASQEVNI